VQSCKTLIHLSYGDAESRVVIRDAGGIRDDFGGKEPSEFGQVPRKHDDGGHQWY
jgi:hypothetical protein